MTKDEKRAQLRDMPDYSIRQLAGMYNLLNVTGAYMDGLLVSDLLQLTIEEGKRRVNERKHTP